ncbi:alternate-type signal peptide domain-containing protein [Paramicrobacterium fandaimingii]|uniref:alternate-type signal peptide domain-containing protein n=1 Tax=Paramicrobacterium fandaimingii TaxID=2708079 RepID=UPI0014212D55|nr:alternate-type signal peptide domain-containing protein [Microbacterium fandaimingii]
MTTKTTDRTSTKGTLTGIVAAAAGVVVLLGGAGSFALWNAQGGLGSENTSTGHLTATFADPTWNDLTPGHEKESVAIDTFHLVPGDVLEGTSIITVDAVGNNIAVNAEVTGPDGAPIGASLPEGVSLDTQVTATNADGETVTTLSEGTSTVTVTVTLSYAVDSGNTSMNTPINLQDIDVTLQQIAPTAG